MFDCSERFWHAFITAFLRPHLSVDETHFLLDGFFLMACSLDLVALACSYSLKHGRGKG